LTATGFSARYPPVALSAIAMSWAVPSNEAKRNVRATLVTSIKGIKPTSRAPPEGAPGAPGARLS
jgi:hypothetical protein